ncbi:hypothetical protein VIBRN418_15548 [Vibrio sp. N418]|uniref:hypothetical protein n=1 Tax=Vibrio sp. (strain N418) TaxID=701176 RepID=UPI00021BDF2F|nr:hypothetical protein [Vibrio sp. N418]EGU34499.1 hypothetical protein VIBRN418_15548 [Vibrio sp. N418]
MRVIVILMSLIVTFGVHATERDKVAKHYVAAIVSHDFEQVAELIHPDALAVFKQKVDNALQSSKQNLVEKELLPLLDVDSRQQAVELTAKQAYINFSQSLMAKFPNQDIEIANSSVEYLGEVTHGDTITVTYKMTFNIGGKSASNIVQHNFKKYQDSWRILLTPETLVYFEQYTSPSR